MEPAARSSGTGRARIERVFALTSVVPLGAFVVFHVLDYARVLAGVRVIGARQAPSAGQLALEALLVWLPFTLHAALSIPIWLSRRREPARGTEQRALLAMHRLAGVAAALFIVDHFVRFRLPILRGALAPADSVQRLAAELSRTQAGFPWMAGVHLLGTIAVAFHLAYGLSRVAQRSPRFAASRGAQRLSLAVGLVLLFTGLFALAELAAG